MDSISRRRRWGHLREAAPAVLPSLLQCDFGNLEREVERLRSAGVEALHLDVMDGHFVPNLTYGLPIVQALRRITDMPLDVHLMISDPAAYAERFAEAGADVMTFHIEAVEDPRPLLAQIRGLGAGAGIALNPGTPTSRLNECWDLCDLVLVMSVPAGFGGQSFDTIALDKLREVRQMAGDAVVLEVDGGIHAQNIGDCAAAGAELFVVGSAIFGHEDYEREVRRLMALTK